MQLYRAYWRVREAHLNSREAFICETSSFPLLLQLVLPTKATCEKIVM